MCENIAQPQLGILCDHIGCMKIALFAKCKFGCIIIVYFFYRLRSSGGRNACGDFFFAFGIFFMF